MATYNGCFIRVPNSTLRGRDKVDAGSSEVSYVSTDNVRVSGSVEFEVHEKKEELILCGPLERVEGTWDNGNETLWSMDCYNVESFGSGGSVFFQPKIEVYVAGCCSGVPLILTIRIQVSPRRKLYRHSMLDVIPEDEGITDSELDDYESEGIAGHDFYLDNMCLGEDGQLSWFNARVRVGVGIGLGMCVGVGIGEEVVKKKYGGMMPKKPPLISKDHERAYFDSADWALGKQGADKKPKGPLEALRPKLQPTQQQTRYRKSPCAPSKGEDGSNAPSEDPTAHE
ncbi:unnamed protein product [Withania somnifera]